MEKRHVPTNKEECSGCTACASICPTGAISIQEDEEGFQYPVVDGIKCIDCKKCVRACSFCNARKLEGKYEECYVAKHRENDVRMGSRSGGIFVACSDWILNRGGSIYGCILDDNNEIKHMRAINHDQRNLMCKSKYAQSSMVGIIDQIVDDLKNGMYVLFTGTACQVAGVLTVLNSLKIELDHFYSMDIVCHGCASPLLFKDYEEWIRSKYGVVPEKFEFRDKSVCGWDGHIESYYINGKKKTSTIWRQIFYTNLALRPSCYNCKFTSVRRASDVTIADAWGIKKALPEFNDNRGVSMFLVHSNKGSELLTAIKKDCVVEKLPLEKMMQTNLQKPSTAKGSRETFWRVYREEGFNALVSKYGVMPIKKQIKAKVKYIVRKLLLSKKYFLP